MKILILHNDYAKYSGEEAVVDKMASMFQTQGHAVCFYRPSSKEERESFVGQIKGFLSGIYSWEGVKRLRDILRKEKPDLVNVHNLFPFISPAALVECCKANIPVVMTVHNYRIMCPTGLFLRAGKPCELCLQQNHEWNCIRYNCENSFPKSLGYALRNMVARQKNYYKNNVDYFVCLTSFQKNKLVQAGYEQNKISVIPNCTDILSDSPSVRGDYIAYAGRLSREKGIDLLCEVARRHPDIPFHLAGEDRMKLCDNIPSNIKLKGHLNKKELQKFIRQSLFMLIPSHWYEGFPMAILDAATLGKPVICPNHGGFPEIIGQGDQSIGKLFSPSNADDLENKILELWNSPDEAQRLGTLAYQKVKHEYDTEVISQKWSNLLSTIPNLY